MSDKPNKNGPYYIISYGVGTTQLSGATSTQIGGRDINDTTDWDKLYQWKQEGRFDATRLGNLGLLLVSLDCAEYRLEETEAWAAAELARIAGRPT